MTTKQRLVVTHAFKGPRFDDHGLDVDVLPDLLAYKTLLVETAKELWRRKHPDRRRLPKGFEDSLRLKFYQLEAGSTAIPLVRNIEYQDEYQENLFGYEPSSDELDEAVVLVADMIEAIATGSTLPESFPKGVIPLFSNYGKTLQEDESFELILPNRSAHVRYDIEIKERLLQRSQAVYEDTVELVGEVRATDLDGCHFILQLDDGRKVHGKFDSAQEQTITRALREHETQRLRIIGRGEFDPRTKGLKQVTRVSQLALCALGEPVFDTSVKPIWDVIAGISASVRDSEWSEEPRDVSLRVDYYLYGFSEGNG